MNFPKFFRWIHNPMLWQKNQNILAFPYGWQHPAKTEEFAYQCCLADLPENRFVEIICFPWATIIDLLRKGQSPRTPHCVLRTPYTV